MNTEIVLKSQDFEQIWLSQATLKNGSFFLWNLDNNYNSNENDTG